ncbi:MAG: hypothetical protein ACU0E9_11525 [Limimaricola soesokkakensis]|uniref:Uncharacterized protein n=1 Tax=Limimaricola soesokkakensis TaxID=1343159 RepID=A0A1X6Z835_9RHOB|nr:hypothetical protein [Limimaricola soesokkakensis]PSK86651.1 hypothetical protein CLV79_10480 [Limimaricola soesokkakensis]SLN42895.1 hypothetical protein LOS8367_01871 [Limimaricola soesokkakensis]
MADLLRPEARAALWRGREVLVGLVLAGLGLWWALASFGILQWLGWGLAALGAGLVIGGVQRWRFRQEGRGPGLLKIDEGRVAYMGPLTGGMVDLDEVRRLRLDRRAKPAHWLLETGTEVLAIPVTADGAEALFDAFAALPGLKRGRMIEMLNDETRDVVTIWTRPARLTVV